MASKKLTTAQKLVRATAKIKPKGTSKYRTKAVTNCNGVKVTCIVFPSDAFQFNSEFEGNERKCVPLTLVSKLLDATEA